MRDWTIPQNQNIKEGHGARYKRKGYQRKIKGIKIKKKPVDKVWFDTPDLCMCRSNETNEPIDCFDLHNHSKLSHSSPNNDAAKTPFILHLQEVEKKYDYDNPWDPSLSFPGDVDFDKETRSRKAARESTYNHPLPASVGAVTRSASKTSHSISDDSSDNNYPATCEFNAEINAFNEQLLDYEANDSDTGKFPISFIESIKDVHNNGHDITKALYACENNAFHRDEKKSQQMSITTPPEEWLKVLPSNKYCLICSSHIPKTEVNSCLSNIIM